jgi:hypothetical protein
MDETWGIRRFVAAVYETLMPSDVMRRWDLGYACSCAGNLTLLGLPENGFGMDAEAEAEWEDGRDCFLQESLFFRLVFGFIVSFSLSSDDDNGSGRLFLRFRFLTFIFCFGCVFFRSKISSESSDESKSMV